MGIVVIIKKIIFVAYAQTATARQLHIKTEIKATAGIVAESDMQQVKVFDK